jgi:polyhydroxyalkanoate synthesis regulator phasin
LTELLRDAAKRGEISPERLTPMVLEVLHALILKHTLLEARDPTKKDITEMIDEVLLPLLVAKPVQQELSARPRAGLRCVVSPGLQSGSYVISLS